MPPEGHSGRAKVSKTVPVAAHRDGPQEEFCGFFSKGRMFCVTFCHCAVYAVIHLTMSGYLIYGCCSQCHRCSIHYHERGDKEGTFICWGILTVFMETFKDTQK